MTLVILHRLSEHASYPLNYEVFCTHCHKSLGRCDDDEVAYLVNYAPLGTVLCYECEDLRLRQIMMDRSYPILSSAIKDMLVEHGLV